MILAEDFRELETLKKKKTSIAYQALVCLLQEKGVLTNNAETGYLAEGEPIEHNGKDLFFSNQTRAMMYCKANGKSGISVEPAQREEFKPNFVYGC